MSTNAGSISQDKAWGQKEQGDEARYAREKEQAQLAALRNQQLSKNEGKTTSDAPRTDIEGGFGGQEDLEDRYATTSGEH